MKIQFTRNGVPATLEVADCEMEMSDPTAILLYIGGSDGKIVGRIRMRGETEQDALTFCASVKAELSVS
jgi:hypothetical protein